MMTPLEKKKAQVELMRVTTARCDLEIRIEEMQLEIKRLEDYITVQVNKEEELKLKLEENK